MDQQIKCGGFKNHEKDEFFDEVYNLTMGGFSKRLLEDIF